jgi:hypothetical protein
LTVSDEKFEIGALSGRTLAPVACLAQEDHCGNAGTIGLE